MPRKKSRKKRKHKKVRIEAIIELGVGALYVRRTWMKKLDELGKRKSRKSKRGSKNS